MKWYLKVLNNYFVFKGRSSRKEFWMFTLFNTLFLTAIHLFSWYTFSSIVIKESPELLKEIPEFNIVNFISISISSLYDLFIFIPALAVTFRRLHDVGKSGWVIINFLIFLFFGMIISSFFPYEWISSLFGLVMIIYIIRLLVLTITKGNDGENKYGVTPKENDNTIRKGEGAGGFMKNIYDLLIGFISIIAILIIVIFILKEPNTNAWKYLKSSSKSDEYACVKFINANIGYVAGDGMILKTTDRGINWTKQISETSNDFECIYFPDANTGYAVGSYHDENMVYSSLILKTTDGGINWSKQNSGSLFDSRLYSVYFVDVNTGFAVGSDGIILKTTDGGINWIKLNSGFRFDYDKEFFSVYFIDVDTGYVAGSDGAIRKTINGGIKWIKQKSGTAIVLHCIYFPDANTGYAVGRDGIILKTINGGIKWTKQNSGTTIFDFTLNSVYFIDANIGYAVGFGWYEDINTGIILKTNNGGTNWSKQNSRTTLPLSSVYFLDSDTGYAVGGWYEGNIILKTTNGGTE